MQLGTLRVIRISMRRVGFRKPFGFGDRRMKPVLLAGSGVQVNGERAHGCFSRMHMLLIANVPSRANMSPNI